MVVLHSRTVSSIFFLSEDRYPFTLSFVISIPKSGGIEGSGVPVILLAIQVPTEG